MKKLMLVMALAMPLMNAGVARLGAKGVKHTVKFGAKAMKKTAKVAWKVAY